VFEALIAMRVANVEAMVNWLFSPCLFRSYRVGYMGRMRRGGGDGQMSGQKEGSRRGVTKKVVGRCKRVLLGLNPPSE